MALSDSLTKDPERLGIWRYFLLLESDFEQTLRYIDPDPKNRGTFSLELARQLLAASAQFELITRLLAGEAARPGAKLTELYDVLVLSSPGLAGWTVTFIPRNEPVSPFTNWTSSSVPSWWSAYNKLKHKPLAHPDCATFGNVLHSMAALGLFTTRYLKHETGPWQPRLFDLNYG